MFGFASAKLIICAQNAAEKSVSMNVSANTVFFITAPNNTSSFHPKRCICKDSLTQKNLTKTSKKLLAAPKF